MDIPRWEQRPACLKEIEAAMKELEYEQKDTVRNFGKPEKNLKIKLFQVYSKKILKKISTHLLTVLTKGVIFRVEQKKFVLQLMQWKYIRR